MNIGDTFVASEVFHDGGIGWNVRMRALIIDSDGKPVLAVNPDNRFTYLYDHGGPDGKPQWINYYPLADFVEQLQAVTRLL